jgi:hypothetical protein
MELYGQKIILMEKALHLHLASHYKQINHNFNNDSIKIEARLEKKEKSENLYNPNKEMLRLGLFLYYCI